MARCTFCQADNDLALEPLSTLGPPRAPLPPLPPPRPLPEHAPHGFAPMAADDPRTNASGSAAGLLGVAVALVIIGGAVGVLMLRSSRASSVSVSPVATAVPYASPPTPAQPVNADNFFVDAHAVPLAFKDKLGASPMGTRLVLYDTYAIAELQDPKHADHLDGYTYRAGSVDAPRPEHFTGTAKELGATVFALESIDYALVPRLTSDARAARHRWRQDLAHHHRERPQRGGHRPSRVREHRTTERLRRVRRQRDDEARDQVATRVPRCSRRPFPTLFRSR
jgi:hypothetical protein